MDAVFPIGEKVILITPARFLFDAGSTPTDWNKKMLSDPNFKVLHYEPNSNNVFGGVDIKGGVVVSYHDSSTNFGPIEVFTPYEDLNSITQKVLHLSSDFISSIAYSRTSYRLTDKMHEDNPRAMSLLSKGHP